MSRVRGRIGLHERDPDHEYHDYPGARVQGQLEAEHVDTHTYLFVADVIRHRRPAAPPSFPTSWGRNRVNYGMDPLVVARYTLAEWKEALTQIPSMSWSRRWRTFSTPHRIYATLMVTAKNGNGPVHWSLLDPTNAVPGRFQENCGLRIRGGFSRDPSFVKHSFRIFFRRAYGAAN